MVWSYRRQLSGLQTITFISKIIFGVLGNYVYYEIASSSSSSPSTGLLRLLRRLGFSFGAAEYIGGARTPAASASGYNIANAGLTPADTPRLETQKLLGTRQDDQLSRGHDNVTVIEQSIVKDKSL